MMAVAWALFAVALGCALVYRFGAVAVFEPSWARALLVFGGGTAAGIGLTSCLFFVCPFPKLAIIFELALLAWLAYSIHRSSQNPDGKGVGVASPYNPLLMGALVAALAIATSAMTDAWQSNPQGGWDAWLIWNLRARYLGSAFPQRAWSAALTGTHPEYPLLLSGFISRCWAYAGSVSESAPIAVSYLFFLALLATLTGGLAVSRSPALGLLAGLALLGSPMFLHEVITQYADIPLACYFAGAAMFALLDCPLVAGLFAGLAAWTKDEGALYLLVFLTAISILRRGQLLRTAAGALPGALLLLIFKLALAPRVPNFFGQSLSAMAAHIVDPARLGQVLGQFARECGAMGIGWYHPVLPVLAIAAALRFDRARRDDFLFAAGLPMAMLAGYVAIFLITPFDLKWQLETSFYRLLAQIWPSILLAVFVALRAPVSEAAPQARKKAKARHA